MFQNENHVDITNILKNLIILFMLKVIIIQNILDVFHIFNIPVDICIVMDDDIMPILYKKLCKSMFTK